MQSAFDELGIELLKWGIELLKWGFRKVVFLEIECKTDGTYRLGVSPEALSGDQFECPKCHARAHAAGFWRQVTADTRYHLNRSFWSGPANWDEISEQEYRAPVPKPGLDGRARHYRKKLQVGATDESAEIFATA